MKAAQDAAQDDLTKEVWNDFSGKFSLNRQVGYGVFNSRIEKSLGLNKATSVQEPFTY